jgi:hypothetical protein
MTYKVKLRVAHLTPSGEVWEASGHGVTVKSKDPETLWALEAIEAGLEPNRSVDFVHQDDTTGMRYRSLLGCSAKASKARSSFAKLSNRRQTDGKRKNTT